MIWYIVFDCVLWDAHTIHDVFTSFSDTSSLTDWSSRRCLDFLISSSWLMCRDVYNTYWMCGFLSSLSTCFCGTFHHNSIQSNTSCLKCVHNSYLGIFVCVCLYVSFYHTNPYDCVPGLLFRLQWDAMRMLNPLPALIRQRFSEENCRWCLNIMAISIYSTYWITVDFWAVLDEILKLMERTQFQVHTMWTLKFLFLALCSLKIFVSGPSVSHSM